jgi:hypothetical protein
MDPILFSATVDKRKGLSLIAPPAAKRKRTTKKVTVPTPRARTIVYNAVYPISALGFKSQLWLS